MSKKKTAKGIGLDDPEGLLLLRIIGGMDIDGFSTETLLNLSEALAGADGEFRVIIEGRKVRCDPPLRPAAEILARLDEMDTVRPK